MPFRDAPCFSKLILKFRNTDGWVTYIMGMLCPKHGASLMPLHFLYFKHFGQRGVHGLTVISTAALVLKRVFEVVPILPKKIEPVIKTVPVLQANRKTASSKNVVRIPLNHAEIS